MIQNSGLSAIGLGFSTHLVQFEGRLALFFRKYSEKQNAVEQNATKIYRSASGNFRWSTPVFGSIDESRILLTPELSK
ncbi:MAG TPA: hypothetical protein VE944_15585 [Nostoc sp.]|uniref:hypothetical protein n=1 Tax=Nostoc sp. TaxID=1180 RepID=UPI002D521E7E|nr:hypothetical protein [Nostoc sp.]HYX15755.1 hypothetical protein [Nostoc sp.]